MTANVGIVLLCRMSSQRLPGKILRQIGGRSVLGHILDRLREGAPDLPIVVATSNDKSDAPITREAAREGVAVFRGSLDDAAGRFLAAAETQGWNYAIRLNGDNILVDCETIQGVAALARSDVFDVISNVPGRTFPKGMSVECLRTRFYAEHLPQMTEAADREHVTSWIYRSADLGHRYVYPNTLCPEAAGLDLSLDTEEDLVRLTDILARAGAAPARLGLRDIYQLATQPETPPSPWRGNSGPLMIAEIGGNHEGNFEYARLLTENAISSGVDCIKFQIYQGDTLVSRIESPDRNNHFKKFELEPEQHLILAQMCRDAGVLYLASVWDEASLEWIDEHLDFYKVGSGDMTAWPMLKVLALRGKPILLSTGLANLGEVLQTVRYLQSLDERYKQPENLCLLQCTAMYPIPDTDAHLRVMDRLAAATRLTIGYSDHTIGMTALAAATAMGAQVLEFHFTDSRDGKTFRDHKVSLTASEVRELRGQLSQITACRGLPIKTPQASELESGHNVSFRRAAYLNRDIAEGETIAENDVVYLRPCHGLDARDADRLIGTVARRPIQALSAIDLDADILK